MTSPTEDPITPSGRGADPRDETVREVRTERTERVRPARAPETSRDETRRTGRAATGTPRSQEAPAGHTRPEDLPEPEATHSASRTAAIWVALVLGAIVLVLLLIFVLQNNTRAQFTYFTATFELPLGVAMLLAAIAGALVMGLVGSVRMAQQSLRMRRMRKNEKAIRALIAGE